MEVSDSSSVIQDVALSDTGDILAYSSTSLN
eukprot:CAMPEP_0178935216 /NCGR_PEP_ID=MMETSP0786-20121207/24382_1 /TAXON_ID=186022 /ORGANISM="Thalassionema frauenfeldii, Strain CCMP 1798" /LENGTH=30 /DNA_ID= /DNA_START= /DNA_END= /DNA_ORIENTATION=